MPIISKNLMIGLPESGKTTFIAALSYVVGSGEVPETLQLRKLNDDTQYLSTVVDEWSDCKPMTRTQTGFSSIISMELAEPGRDSSIELSLPDVSGEKFQQQWLDRQWDDVYEKLVGEATGMLLMVHCNKIIEPRTIRDAANALGRMKLEDELEEDNGEQYVPWEPSKASTGVQLVDLLQFILDARCGLPALRLAVIISAWDLVEGLPITLQPRTPEQWLEKRIPLLYQFLRANGEDLESRVFGVSAQGGNVTDPTDLLRLQHQPRPAKRIIVCDDNGRTHDITKPIRWLTDISNIT